METGLDVLVWSLIALVALESTMVLVLWPPFFRLGVPLKQTDLAQLPTLAPQTKVGTASGYFRQVSADYMVFRPRWRQFSLVQYNSAVCTIEWSGPAARVVCRKPVVTVLWIALLALWVGAASLLDGDTDAALLLFYLVWFGIMSLFALIEVWATRRWLERALNEYRAIASRGA